MANGIVENLDFFDADIYSEDIERLEPEDEEDVDPSQFEKKKETFSLYENEMVRQQSEDKEKYKEPSYEEFKCLDEDWEEFNQKDFKGY